MDKTNTQKVNSFDYLFLCLSSQNGIDSRISYPNSFSHCAFLVNSPLQKLHSCSNIWILQREVLEEDTEKQSQATTDSFPFIHLQKRVRQGDTWAMGTMLIVFKVLLKAEHLYGEGRLRIHFASWKALLYAWVWQKDRR